MSLASPLVSRALSRIAVFLPSRSSAASTQRCSVSSASLRIRCRTALTSSSLTSRSTFCVASWAACARPRTSASFSSSVFNSAIADSPRAGLGQECYPHPRAPNRFWRLAGTPCNGQLLRGERRQQVLACLFTPATHLGANTAVLMVIGVPLTLVPAQSASPSARLHDRPRHLRLKLRLPAYHSLCRRTDIAAVQA